MGGRGGHREGPSSPAHPHCVPGVPEVLRPDDHSCSPLVHMRQGEEWELCTQLPELLSSGRVNPFQAGAAINLEGWCRAGGKGSHEDLGAQRGCAGGMARGCDLSILKKGPPGQVSGHT